jgi:hypothetical protein
MRSDEGEVIWVVVTVAAGIPVSVQGFRQREAARKHERRLRKHMHPENDETGLFAVDVVPD